MPPTSSHPSVSVLDTAGWSADHQRPNSAFISNSHSPQSALLSAAYVYHLSEVIILTYHQDMCASSPHNQQAIDRHSVLISEATPHPVSPRTWSCTELSGSSRCRRSCWKRNCRWAALSSGLYSLVRLDSHSPSACRATLRTSSPLSSSRFSSSVEKRHPHDRQSHSHN